MEGLDFLNLSTMSENKEFIEYGEQYKCKIILRNRSERNLFNISIKDCIIEGTKFLAGSVKINGKSDIGSHLALGINIVSLKALEEARVEFILECTLKSGGILKPLAKIEYQYYDERREEYKLEKKMLLGSEIKVNSAILKNKNLRFEASEKNLSIEDSFYVSLNITNEGNISANNVTLSINMPNEIKRADNRVFIGTKEVVLDSGLKEIRLGNLESLKELKIKFKCVAVKMTEGSGTLIGAKISYVEFVRSEEGREKSIYIDTAKIDIGNPIIKYDYEISDQNPTLNDNIDLRLLLKNVGNIEAINGKLFLDVGSGCEVIKGSLKINGEKGEVFDIVKGIDIKKLKKNVAIIDLGLRCIDDSNRLNFIGGKFAYEYELLKGEKLRYSEKILEKIDINIEKADIFIEVTKDKENVVLNDIIKYELKIVNRGSVEALNVCIKGEFKKQLEFLKGSIEIDGKKFSIGDIQRGIYIGNIDREEEALLSFKSEVKSITGDGKLILDILGKFQYRSKNSTIREKKIEKKSVSVLGGVALFKAIDIEGVIDIGKYVGGAKEVLSVDTEVFVNEKYIIDTYKGISNENKIVTGKKLVINGAIENRVEYICAQALENTFFGVNRANFSTFIILPETINRVDEILIIGNASDSYTRILGNKKIYILSTINIEGRILS